MCHDEAGRGGYRKEIRRKDQVLAAEYAPEIVPTFVLFKDKKSVGVMGGMVDEHTFESRMLEILS